MDPAGRAEFALFTSPLVVGFCDAGALLRRVFPNIGAFSVRE
jgi:hypothetical protein